MSRKNRFSIRNPRFRKGAGANAMKVDHAFDRLLSEKKDQIRQLIRDLHYSGAISEYAKCERESSQRALVFELVINHQIIITKFIIWTDNRPPDFVDFFNLLNQKAQFVIRLNENIKDLEQRVLSCIESAQKGATTEFMAMTAMEELIQESFGQRMLMYFRKSKPYEDKYKGTDAVIFIIHDGRNVDIPIQFKSSKEKLMEHKEKHPNVPGLSRVFTGNQRKEIDIIKTKIVQIIDAYKKGEVIWI